MIPAFTLTRSIDILVNRFAGEVAKEEKRPELMPFLLMARDHGEITDRSAAGHLLGASEGRRQVARRLLEQLERSGALEKQEKDRWKLTEAGREAVETEVVFIAERGSWEVWHACDPLLPHGLIQLTPYKEPKAFDEVRKDAPKRKATPLHRTLEALKDLPLSPIMGGARRRIGELPTKVEELGSKTGTLAWEVASRRLSVTIDEKSFDLAAPSLSHDATFEALLATAGLTSDWDKGAEVLRRSFGDLPEASRRSMCEDVTFPGRIRLLDYGGFDMTTVRGIRINARTRTDAEAWASWRLEDKIDDIACTRRFAEWSEWAQAPFEYFAPIKLPLRSDLAARTRPAEPSTLRSAVAWNLIAAEDWNL
ncbi:hypothetical protein [Rhodovulum sulfidophilum]|uniref:hypothetical protein n=1 Tax=Rhodovulum sulfidophilum TaxID=35806 RepID=UPI001F456660|nr:hypothetical protein [Rhodovulum sulfidophilum]MCE8439456.1 hypothetical protein [Rhodovulum sulfidophilum]